MKKIKPSVVIHLNTEGKFDLINLLELSICVGEPFHLYAHEDVEKLTKQCNKLLTFIRRHHLPTCGIYKGPLSGPKGACDCGVDELIRSIEKDN